MQGGDVKVMGFEMEITDILEMKAYELTIEEKVPVIKHWLRQDGLQLIKTFTQKTKWKCRTAKGVFLIQNTMALCYKSNTANCIEKTMKLLKEG